MRNKKIDVNKIVETIKECPSLSNFVLNKTNLLLDEFDKDNLQLFNEENRKLSEAEQLIDSSLQLNQFIELISSMTEVYNSLQFCRKYKYFKYYDLIFRTYDAEKSAYKCQEKLREQGVKISVTQIYNILHRYEKIEEEQ